ncbi:4Fe-4S domain-containing protein [Streptomyces sp. NPDC008150]|uniref:ferredoxin n=1 Tax=Streptomyces sp. NPDC008150 TaxID=3364816 RepID=UPI0036EF7F2E
MKATISIDPGVCRSMGLCQAMDADLFEVSGNSRAVVRRSVLTDPDRIDLAEAIAECCPTGAITVDTRDAATPADGTGPGQVTHPPTSL